METGTRGSTYAPNLDGFVWNPRFLTFSGGGTFASQTVNVEDGTNEFVRRDPYRLRLNFFPQALNSFTVHAARATSQTTVKAGLVDTTSTSTSESQGFIWRYRGSPLLPETVLDFKRETTENDTSDVLSEERKTTIALRARKNFERANPVVGYTLEQLERVSPTTEGGGVGSAGVTHLFQYDDRVRVGERALLTPSAQYRLSPSGPDGTTALTIAGPLSTTLDGTGGIRHSFAATEATTTQTTAVNGALTKRFSPNLTLVGGLNGVLVNAEDMTWSGGGFSAVTATPLPQLRTATDYNLQLNGQESGVTVAHRGHAGILGTFIPRHTLTADYFLNVSDRGSDLPLFVGHSGALTVTSLLIPLTTLTGTYGVDVQEGDGRREGQTWKLGAAVTPLPIVSLRASGEYGLRSTSGGSHVATDETARAVEAGVDATPFLWLRFSVTGRHGEREIREETRLNEFVSDRLTGSADMSFGNLAIRGTGFLEQERIIELERKGFLGALTYRFRVWTITVDFERSSSNIASAETERQRFFFRITRPLDFTFGRP